MHPGDLLAGANGRYEVIQRIVRGETTSVYRGRDGVLGNDVAIKMMRQVSSEAADRFRLEVNVLRALAHPNIARFLDFIDGSTGRYLVQSWVEGPSLRRRLDTTGLTPVEAVALGRDVASALAEAHRHNVIHRDIKPGNILWSGTSWVVIDFGIARVLGEEFHLTRTGAVLGTLGYMAPEQACAAHDVDERADVFALGCVLYEALTGRLAFDGDSRLAIEAKLIVVDPEPIGDLVPELPPALCELVTRCLCKAPPGRPANGAEAASELAAIASGGLPALPARRVQRSELPTVQDETTPIVSIVVTAPLADPSASALTAWERRVREALGPFGGNPIVLQTGAVLFVAPETLSPSIDVAAAAALALQDHAPETPIAIASSRGSGQVAASLETAGTAVERAGLEALFADHASSNIRLDVMTAGHLGSQFQIITIDDVCYLSGWR